MISLSLTSTVRILDESKVNLVVESIPYVPSTAVRVLNRVAEFPHLNTLLGKLIRTYKICFIWYFFMDINSIFTLATS